MSVVSVKLIYSRMFHQNSDELVFLRNVLMRETCIQIFCKHFTWIINVYFQAKALLLQYLQTLKTWAKICHMKMWTLCNNFQDLHWWTQNSILCRLQTVSYQKRLYWHLNMEWALKIQITSSYGKPSLVTSLMELRYP